jgi:hypothetical protein
MLGGLIEMFKYVFLVAMETFKERYSSLIER